MNVKLEAIYEDGVLKPFGVLPLPEHSRVFIAVVGAPETDDERRYWLSISEARLVSAWDDAKDDVYNELLER